MGQATQRQKDHREIHLIDIEFFLAEASQRSQSREAIWPEERRRFAIEYPRQSKSHDRPRPCWHPPPPNPSAWCPSTPWIVASRKMIEPTRSSPPEAAPGMPRRGRGSSTECTFTGGGFPGGHDAPLLPESVLRRGTSVTEAAGRIKCREERGKRPHPIQEHVPLGSRNSGEQKPLGRLVGRQRQAELKHLLHDRLHGRRLRRHVLGSRSGLVGRCVGGPGFPAALRRLPGSCPCSRKPEERETGSASAQRTDQRNVQ